MSVWLSPIIVALIGGPLMFLLRKLERNNTNQHGTNVNLLKEIKSTIGELRTDLQEVRTDLKVVQSDVKHVQSNVQHIDERLEHHINWHMDQKVST